MAEYVTGENWLAKFHELILMPVDGSNIRSVVAKLEHVDRNKPSDQTDCSAAVQTFLRGNRDIHTFLERTIEIKGERKVSDLIHAAKARTLVYNILLHLMSFDNSEYDANVSPSLLQPRFEYFPASKEGVFQLQNMSYRTQSSMGDMDTLLWEDISKYRKTAKQFMFQDIGNLLEKAREAWRTLSVKYGDKELKPNIHQPGIVDWEDREEPLSVLDDVITDGLLHRVGRMIRMDAMKSLAIELMEFPDSIVHDTYSTKGDEANYRILLLWREQNNGTRRQLHHMLSAALNRGINISIDALDLILDYSSDITGGGESDEGAQGGQLSVVDDVIRDDLLHRVGRMIRMDAMKSVAIELMEFPDSIVHDTYSTKGDEANYRILLLWRNKNNGTRRQLHHMLSAALDSNINISIDALDLILNYSGCTSFWSKLAKMFGFKS